MSTKSVTIAVPREKRAARLDDAGCCHGNSGYDKPL
jgi:hypothetical protein